LAEQNPLGKRLTWSAVIVIITACAIFFAPRFVFLAAVEIFIIWGLYEFYLMAERKGVYINKTIGMCFAAMMPLSSYFPAESLIVEMALLCLFLVQFDSSAPRSSIVGVAVTLLGVLYVGWLFSFFVKIKLLEDGAKWVFYTAFVTKMCDTGAFFIGRKWGHKKLIPHISPNKTVEGAIGGLTCAVLASLFSKTYLGDIVPTGHLLLLGFFVGIMSEFGDLAESLIKRDAGMKDSGALPGLGGILDVIDSLLFTAPLVHFYLTVVLGVHYE
jgi:phosphatidate cytidylyltransferase